MQFAILHKNEKRKVQGDGCKTYNDYHIDLKTIKEGKIKYIKI